MNSQQEETLEKIVTRCVATEDAPRAALLPILHAVQAEYGFVSEDAVRQIAARLNLTRAEVHGVMSFYHDFRSEPATLPVIKLCRAEACKARGVEALVPEAERAASGKVMIETVYCLGLCAVGPNAMTGNAVHGRLDAAKLGKLIEVAA